MADAVQVVDGRISVDLPYASLAILATARRDRVFYRIAGPDGADVTGYSGLAAAAGPATSHRPRFVDARYRDTPVRAVLLGRLVAEPGGPMATVVVAHSRDEREALAASILANAFGPILLLTLLAGALIWFAVRQALAPLGTIGRLVRDRAPTDLSPIAAPAPAEVRQLLAALNQFMARLQANLSLMQSFLGDAAHQMRTPLATLRAQADLAVERIDGDDALRAGVSGSVALVDGHLAASRRIDRAFGLVNLPGFPDVRVYLDNREVGRTDASGRLLLPSLRPYEENRVRLEIDDLPLDADLATAEVEAVPYERSGMTIPFPLERRRQATAVLVRATGGLLPPGTRLVSGDGAVTAWVARDGFSQISGVGPAITLQGEVDGITVACEVPAVDTSDMLPDLGELRCR